VKKPAEAQLGEEAASRPELWALDEVSHTFGCCMLFFFALLYSLFVAGSPYRELGKVF
jgi:hypothetical protein